MSKSVEIPTENDWSRAINLLGDSLKRPQTILTLTGDLGAGKTTFTQVLADHLGVQEKVTSPTFSIVQEYDLVDGPFYHIDLYRIENEEELYEFDLEHYLKGARLTVIEWPEIGRSFFDPSKTVDVRIDHLPKGGRRFVLLESVCSD